MWAHPPYTQSTLTRRAMSRAASAGASKRAAHEAALRKWIDCMGAVNAQLALVGRLSEAGHASTLRHQVWLVLGWRGCLGCRQKETRCMEARAVLCAAGVGGGG